MGQPYVGEIRMFGGSFPPNGWAFCDGGIIAISENDVLYTLIGTTYGGDGQETFGLPDLRGRLPVHQGPGFTIGQAAGTEQETLNTQQMPVHNHPALAQSQSGNQPGPGNGIWAASTLNQFSTNNGNTPMGNACLQPAGGSQPHDNMMPFLVVSFIISLYGVFPTQN